MASPYIAAATGGPGDVPSNDEATPGTMTATAPMPSGGGIRRRGPSPPVMAGDPNAAGKHGQRPVEAAGRSAVARRWGAGEPSGQPLRRAATSAEALAAAPTCCHPG